MSIEFFGWAWRQRDVTPVQKLLMIYISNYYARYSPAETKPFRLNVKRAAEFACTTDGTVRESLRLVPGIVWRLDGHENIEIHITEGAEGFYAGFGRSAIFEGDDR